MADSERPPKVQIFAIGVIQLEAEDTELRCVHEPWGWRPDILVNRKTETVSPPPPCFELDDFATAALDLALAEFRRNG